MMKKPDADNPLKIGTRGSKLALAQAYETRDRLIAAHGLDESCFEIVPIKTTGDRITDRPLSEVGGKGLFTREIEDALLAGVIDIAVHSMKDMPTIQPNHLVIDCLLPREDPRDAFVSFSCQRLDQLPHGAVVGSSSLRRRAQLRHLRADLQLVEFRGNVNTRLQKLRDGVASATFLAVAGLNRLGMPEIACNPIATNEMLPAVGQGAIGVERREADEAIAAFLTPIHDAETGTRISAERAFLARLDGSCQTPIAGFAQVQGADLRLEGEILRPDGSERVQGRRDALAKDAEAMGRDLAEELLSRAGPGFLAGH